MERGSWCELVVLTINEKAHICGLSCHQEPRLLCVSFYVSSPSGRCPAETANFLFLLVLSLYRPIMIGGLASLCFELYLVDIKYFNLNLFRIGFQKGTLKYNHSTLNGSSTPSEFKITCQCSHVCYELGADTGFTVSAKLNWQISIRHQTR